MNSPENAPDGTPSVPVLVPCPDCGGTGSDDNGATCSGCNGRTKRAVAFTDDF